MIAKYNNNNYVVTVWFAVYQISYRSLGKIQCEKIFVGHHVR